MRWTTTSRRLLSRRRQTAHSCSPGTPASTYWPGLAGLFSSRLQSAGSCCSPAAPKVSLTKGRCTDWPHDLTAYNPNPQEPWRNAGSIRQPFPDATLALSTIFFLSDVGPDRGGTWVVPRSFRDPRNPRGVHDGIDSFSSIPGQLQVTAKAGDVFVQDTR